MQEQDQERAMNPCVLGYSGPQPILINQVVGTGETQKTLDIHLRVPKRKPAIEQIIDVFVKSPCITHVEVLTGRVIVRGYFEVKALYVACAPSQPVHAVEARHIRFTADVPVYNARCGMDAEASVFTEYIDYDCDHSCRPYWYKQRDRYYKPKYMHEDGENNPKYSHKPAKKHSHYDDCDCGCDCEDKYEQDDCEDHHHHHHHEDCGCPPKKKPRKCCREFDVSVVLGVRAKVMSTREVMLYPQYPGVPLKPKG